MEYDNAACPDLPFWAWTCLPDGHRSPVSIMVLIVGITSLQVRRKPELLEQDDSEG